MDRRTLLFSGLAMLPVAALPMPAGAQPRVTRRRQTVRAKPAARRRLGLVASHVRTRIVTRTFTSRVPIPLPREAKVGLPYPSTILVGGFRRGRILNVRVTLIGLTHVAPYDLDIMVVAPGNVGVILLSDTGIGSAVSGITIAFDQHAATRAPDSLRSGTFQPVNNLDAIDGFPAPAPVTTSDSLSRFNNRNPNGIWRLFVQDDAPNTAAGSLAGWSLQIRARVRLPHRHRRSGSRRPTRRVKR